MKKYIILGMLIIISSVAFATLKISGHADIRPRFDMKDYEDGEGNLTKQLHNLYFQYRARVNIRADIGEHYYFNGMLGHNALAMMTNMADGTAKPKEGSDNTAQAPSVDWMQLYIARDGDFGWQFGRVPLAGNILLDMHYYPTKVHDLPFLIYNNNAYTGGKVYARLGDGRLTGIIAIDQDVVNHESYDAGDSTVTDQDGMTVALQYDRKFGKLSVSPEIYYSAHKSNQNPLTVGALLGYDVAEFHLFGGAGYTRSREADRYDGYTYQVGAKRKLGPGSLKADYNGAMVDRSSHGGAETEFSFWKIAYYYKIAAGQHGDLTLRPQWRHYRKQVIDGEGYIRNKWELYLSINFK